MGRWAQTTWRRWTATILWLAAGVAGAQDRAAWPEWIPAEVDVSWQTIEKRRMEQSGGLNSVPAYKHFRMSSTRLLATAGYPLGTVLRGTATLGIVRHRAHSSEGESRESDWAPALGLGVQAALAPVEGVPLDVTFGAGFLWYDADGGTVKYVRHAEDYAAYDRLDLEWLEWELSARLGYRLGNTRLTTGLRYKGISADGRQDVNTGPQTGSHDTSYRPDDAIGLLAGLEYRVAANMDLGAELDYLDETAFALRCRYRF